MNSLFKEYKQLINLFIQKYLPSTYHIPDTAWGYKTHILPMLQQFTFLLYLIEIRSGFLWFALVFTPQFHVFSVFTLVR